MASFMNTEVYLQFYELWRGDPGKIHACLSKAKQWPPVWTLPVGITAQAWASHLSSQPLKVAKQELKKTFDLCTFLHLFNHISEIRVCVSQSHGSACLRHDVCEDRRACWSVCCKNHPWNYQSWHHMLVIKIYHHRYLIWDVETCRKKEGHITI